MKEEQQQTVQQQEPVKLDVCGYQFTSPEDAAAARQEYTAVQYLKKKLNFQDREMLFKVYRNALDARTFQTPVGLTFLQAVRNQLLKLGMTEEEVPLIQMYVNYTKKLRDTTNPAVKRIEPDQKKKKLDKYRTSLLLNFFLVVMVIGMVIIALNAKSPNILNYEKAVVNKYSAWEETLSERESAVREKEQELSRETNP